MVNHWSAERLSSVLVNAACWPKTESVWSMAATT